MALTVESQVGEVSGGFRARLSRFRARKGCSWAMVVKRVMSSMAPAVHAARYLRSVTRDQACRFCAVILLINGNESISNCARGWILTSSSDGWACSHLVFR